MTLFRLRVISAHSPSGENGLNAPPIKRIRDLSDNEDDERAEDTERRDLRDVANATSWLASYLSHKRLTCKEGQLTCCVRCPWPKRSPVRA